MSHMIVPGAVHHTARICGVHDGLSAAVAQEAGFDALWASGLGMSAVLGMPDRSLATMTEIATLVGAILRSTSLPVFVDCDTGYGDASNAARTSETFSRMGAAGICIEDKSFPKTNSFSERQLDQCIAIDLFQDKIRAACEARTHKGFKVIARCESLIMGLGLADALERCRAYKDAGADMLFVHSKSTDCDEVNAFLCQWPNASEIVLCPTTYPDMTHQLASKLGLFGVILANQIIRSSWAAMQATAKILAEPMGSLDTEPRIPPLRSFLAFTGNA